LGSLYQCQRGIKSIWVITKSHTLIAIVLGKVVSVCEEVFLENSKGIKTD
jgi:hypothetical protein